MYKEKYYKDMSVTFTDVMFHGQVKLDTEDVTRLRLMIHKGSNRFEVIMVLLIIGLHLNTLHTHMDSQPYQAEPI